MLTVKVVFFASFKDILGESQIEIQLPKSTQVEGLCRLLCSKGDCWQQVFGNEAQIVKIAVNQEMVDVNALLSDGDEVAFFPPVTGG